MTTNSDCSTNKTETILKLLKNNHKIISLMKQLEIYKINIDDLNEKELNKLFECILIVSR